MTDQTIEQRDQDPAGDEAIAGPFKADPTSRRQVETILDLDHLLESAKLATRTVDVCIRGDLLDQEAELTRELSTLVDADGDVITEGDESLGDTARVEELLEERRRLRSEIRAASYKIRFRAMDSDEWEAFEDSHRTGTDRRLKNQRRYEHEIIAKCAIAPTMTAKEVEEKLRKHVNQAQFIQIYNAAYFVNTADGINIPFSLSSSDGPRPDSRARSSS